MALFIELYCQGRHSTVYYLIGYLHGCSAVSLAQSPFFLFLDIIPSHIFLCIYRVSVFTATLFLYISSFHSFVQPILQFITISACIPHSFIISIFYSIFLSLSSRLFLPFSFLYQLSLTFFVSLWLSASF